MFCTKIKNIIFVFIILIINFTKSSTLSTTTFTDLFSFTLKLFSENIFESELKNETIQNFNNNTKIVNFIENNNITNSDNNSTIVCILKNSTIEKAVDCSISQWSSWSDCLVEAIPKTNCGLGYRERFRQIIKPEENGGIECPSDLKQQIGCFKQCEIKIDDRGIEMDEEDEGEYTRPDVTTVALLLDYQFNNSRKFLPRHLKKTQIGSSRRRGKLIYKKYCVIYTIEWLNRNCIELQWKNKLKLGKRICAECQPEAQYHRPRARCASDLEDGQTGFWKLIGPTSCYGIWRRHYSDTNDCNCSQSYSNFEPFLLV